MLLRQAFSGTDIVVKDFEGPANQMCTMFARSVSTSIPSLPPMKILCGPTESLEKANLSKQLLLSMREKGLDCQCTPWIVGPVSDDIVYVVLDSSDRLLLAEPTAKEFQQIRDVVTQAKKILWVTCPLGNTTVQDSRRGLITGFARAARSENQALQLITLDICQSPGQTSQPTPRFNFDIVSDVFAITFNTRRCGIMSEAEFTYRDGKQISELRSCLSLLLSSKVPVIRDMVPRRCSETTIESLIFVIEFFKADMTCISVHG